jgi:hypothetical protein
VDTSEGAVASSNGRLSCMDSFVITSQLVLDSGQSTTDETNLAVMPIARASGALARDVNPLSGRRGS